MRARDCGRNLKDGLIVQPISLHGSLVLNLRDTLSASSNPSQSPSEVPNRTFISQVFRTIQTRPGMSSIAIYQ